MHPLKGKKVLIVLHADGIGGAENQSLLYGAYLRDQYACNVIVWNFLEGTSDLRKRVADNEFSYKEIFFPGSKNTFKQKLKLIILQLRLIMEKPDIILPYTIIPNVYMNIAGGKFNERIITAWNQRDEGIIAFEYDRKLLERSVSMSRLIISNSAGGIDYLDQLGADRSSCHLIPNGIPEKFFHDPARSPVTSRHDRYDHLCCMIANLHSNKDHLTLIKAWKNVTEHFSRKDENCMLILAGGMKKTTSQIRALISELSLEDSVRLDGFVTDIPQLIRNVDIVIHCAPSEGTSNSVLEAMAGGRALVATNIKSIAGTVHESNMEFLYRDGDVEGLSRNIIRLLESPDLAARIGSDNYKKARTEYSLSSYFKSMDSVLAGAINSRKRSR